MKWHYKEEKPYGEEACVIIGSTESVWEKKRLRYTCRRKSNGSIMYYGRCVGNKLHGMITHVEPCDWRPCAQTVELLPVSVTDQFTHNLSPPPPSPSEVRSAEASKIREKHPDRVPVSV